MGKTVLKSRRRNRGQGLTEYIIIVALIAIAAVAVVMLFGKQVRHTFLTATHSLAGQGTGEQVDQTSSAGTAGDDQDVGLDDFDQTDSEGDPSAGPMTGEL